MRTPPYLPIVFLSLIISISQYALSNDRIFKMESIGNMQNDDSFGTGSSNQDITNQGTSLVFSNSKLDTCSFNNNCLTIRSINWTQEEKYLAIGYTTQGSFTACRRNDKDSKKITSFEDGEAGVFADETSIVIPTLEREKSTCTKKLFKQNMNNFEIRVYNQPGIGDPFCSLPIKANNLPTAISLNIRNSDNQDNRCSSI